MPVSKLNMLRNILAPASETDCVGLKKCVYQCLSLQLCLRDKLVQLLPSQCDTQRVKQLFRRKNKFLRYNAVNLSPHRDVQRAFFKWILQFALRKDEGIEKERPTD